MQNNPFKYCPNCKSENHTFVENKRFHCDRCDFTFYQNVAGATAVLLYFEKEILFTVRNENPKKGMLDLPGGFIDQNETAEEGAVREIREELGIELNLNLLRYEGSQPNIYPYKDITYHTIDLYFSYPLEKQEFIFNGSEIIDVKWLNINEINLEDLAFDSHSNFFRQNQKNCYGKTTTVNIKVTK